MVNEVVNEVAAYIPSWFVIVLGLATVFVGLIILIYVCKIMSFFCLKFGNDKKAAPAPAPVAAPAPAAVPNNPELVAAVGAAIAEDLGENASAIRIKSIKKV